MHSSAIRFVRHISELGRWEIAERGPRPALAQYVARYGGFSEDTPNPLRRREFASTLVVLVIDFSSSLRVQVGNPPGTWSRSRYGFAAGLQDSIAVTEHPGRSQGMIVEFLPLGARLFFDRPLDELAGRLVPLEDVCGRSVLEFRERLHDMPRWDARFELLDDWIGARIGAAHACPALVVEAVRRIDAAGGAVDVRRLALDLDCTRQHLHARFHEHVGIAPKLYARIVRFERAVAQIEHTGGAGLARIAHAAGYYDQAHLIRDFRAFSGGSPREFLRRSRPDSGGVSDG